MKKIIVTILTLMSLAACGANAHPTTPSATPDQQYLTDIYNSGVVASTNRAESDPYLTKMGHELICPTIGVPGVTHQALVMMGAKGAAAWSSQPTLVADAVITAAEKNLCPDKSYAEAFVRSATAPAVETLPIGSYGPGTYVVGTDIQPGIYTTSGPNGTSSWLMCYFARRRNLDGDLSGIIANGNFKGRMTLNIKPTDVAVEFGQDCVWTKK